jgi:integrase
MPSKIKKRGENSYLLSVKHEQKEYTKTVNAATLPEVEKLWKLFSAEVLKGHALVSGKKKMTLDEFYIYWKQYYAESNLEQTTIVYNDNLFTRIRESLGHLKIDKVLPRHILEFVDQLGAPDAAFNNKPLSRNTIRKHYNLLKTLFNAAVMWEFIIDNPVSKVAAPKKEKVHKKILSEEEMSRFLAKLAEHKIPKHHLWVMLAFSLGLRREEIFGLKWQDINFEKETVSIATAVVYVAGTGIIVKGTKSDGSERTISLPRDIITMLLDWKLKVEAAAKRRAKRQKVVKLDSPTSPEKWVFPKADGTVGHPHAFNNFIWRFCNDNNLPNVSPHLFRHMMGSYLLRSGVDLATISKKLGHSNASFTADIYIHSLQSAEKQSSDVMQTILTNLKDTKNKGQAN